MDSLIPLSAAIEEHGGKAAGLRSLISLGFRVPGGISLGVDAIDALLNGSKASIDLLESWLKQNDGRLAIRSSALREDGLSQSYAGMFESRLGVPRDLHDVIQAIDEISSSGASERVRSYSGQLSARIPVVVQEMVEPRVSGVIFTHAVGRDGRTCCLAEWLDGLGEDLVAGRQIPARLIVAWDDSKRTLDRSEVLAERKLLNPGDLAQLCDAVDHINSAHKGQWDIEWSIDAEGVLWLLQLRPITRPVLVPATDGTTTTVAASPGVASGTVFIVDDEGDVSGLQDGNILVAEITEVDFVPAMRRASAIVTEQGGILSHAAIIARELGKPCVVGATDARRKLRSGLHATVDGTAGTVQQGPVILGTSQPEEIDWRALFLYDRGLEMDVHGHRVYVESVPAGLTAYLAEDADAEVLAAIERELRVHFRRTATVVRDQKLLWFYEWRRFYQLAPVTYFEGRLKTALARWDVADLERIISAMKSVAARLMSPPPTAKLEELYIRELGAALHALTNVLVEGMAVWYSFRDTSLWRQENQVIYRDFLGMTMDDPRHTTATRRIQECLEPLARLRNESYTFFISSGAFSLDYFRDRANLVAAICNDQEVVFQDESENLDILYQTSSFHAYERTWIEHAIRSTLTDPD